jgi:hypothetical protein
MEMDACSFVDPPLAAAATSRTMFAAPKAKVEEKREAKEVAGVVLVSSIKLL